MLAIATVKSAVPAGSPLNAIKGVNQSTLMNKTNMKLVLENWGDRSLNLDESFRFTLSHKAMPLDIQQGVLKVAPEYLTKYAIDCDPSIQRQLTADSLRGLDTAVFVTRWKDYDQKFLEMLFDNVAKKTTTIQLATELLIHGVIPANRKTLPIAQDVILKRPKTLLQMDTDYALDFIEPDFFAKVVAAATDKYTGQHLQEMYGKLLDEKVTSQVQGADLEENPVDDDVPENNAGVDAAPNRSRSEHYAAVRKFIAESSKSDELVSKFISFNLGSLAHMGEDGLKMDGKYLEQVSKTCKFSSYNFGGTKIKFASAKKYMVVGAYFLSTPVYSGMCFIAFHGPNNNDFVLLRGHDKTEADLYVDVVHLMANIAKKKKSFDWNRDAIEYQKLVGGEQDQPDSGDLPSDLSDDATPVTPPKSTLPKPKNLTGNSASYWQRFNNNKKAGTFPEVSESLDEVLAEFGAQYPVFAVLAKRDVVLPLFAIANDMELDSATKVFPFKNKRAAIALEYDPKTRKYVFNARQIDSDGDPAGKRAAMGNPFDLNSIALKLFRLILTTAQKNDEDATVWKLSGVQATEEHQAEILEATEIEVDLYEGEASAPQGGSEEPLTAPSLLGDDDEDEETTQPQSAPSLLDDENEDEEASNSAANPFADLNVDSLDEDQDQQQAPLVDYDVPSEIEDELLAAVDAMNNDPREVEEKFKELRVKALKQMIRDVQNNETQKFLDYPLASARRNPVLDQLYVIQQVMATNELTFESSGERIDTVGALVERFAEEAIAKITGEPLEGVGQELTAERLKANIDAMHEGILGLIEDDHSVRTMEDSADYRKAASKDGIVEFVCSLNAAIRGSSDTTDAADNLLAYLQEYMPDELAVISENVLTEQDCEDVSKFTADREVRSALYNLRLVITEFAAARAIDAPEEVDNTLTDFLNGLEQNAQNLSSLDEGNREALLNLAESYGGTFSRQDLIDQFDSEVPNTKSGRAAHDLFSLVASAIGVNMLPAKYIEQIVSAEEGSEIAAQADRATEVFNEVLRGLTADATLEPPSVAPSVDDLADGGEDGDADNKAAAAEILSHVTRMLTSFKKELPDEYEAWPPGDASPWESMDDEGIVAAIKDMFDSAEDVESLAEENYATIRVANYDDLSDAAKEYFDNMTSDSVSDFSLDTVKKITALLGGNVPSSDEEPEDEDDGENAESEATQAIYDTLNSFKKHMPEEFNAWPERDTFVKAWWESNDIQVVADLFKNWHNYANDIYGQADEAGMDVDVHMFEDLSEDAQMFLDDFDISDPTSYDFDGLNEIYELLRDDATVAPKSRAPALDMGDDEDEDVGAGTDNQFDDLKVDELDNLTPDEEPNMFDGKIDVSDIDPTDDDLDAELDMMLSGGKSKPTSAPKVDDDLSLEDLGDDDLSLEGLGDDDLSLESLEPSGAKPGVDDDLSLEDLGDDFGADEEVGSSPLTSNDVVEYAAAIRAAKPGASRWSDIPNDHNAIYRFLNAVSDGDKAAHARVLLANRPDLKVTISSVMEDEFYEPNWEDENADDPFAGDDSNPLDNIFGGGDSGDIGADDDDLGYLLADAPKSGKTGAKVMDYNTALNTLGLDSAPFSDEDVQNAQFLLLDPDSPAYPALEAMAVDGKVLSQNVAAVMADHIVNGSSIDLGPVGAIKDTVKRAGAGGKQALEALLVEALGGAGEMYTL